MINIDTCKLNPLEKNIHQIIQNSAKEENSIKIDRAAELCDCSVSKISKFVKKLGFDGYKQYMNFIYNTETSKKPISNEIERIKHFLNNFDVELVDRFVEEINSYEKIILFGYGPSYLCAQYFEYKLRFVTNKIVISVPDEISVESLLDEKTMLIIFSTTGNFKSFEKIHNYSKTKNSSFMLILEEYNTSVSTLYDKVLFLTDTFQDPSLSPYEKSRIVFFIFIEEVIQHILIKSKT